jgi:hypothetical protein
MPIEKQKPQGGTSSIKQRGVLYERQMRKKRSPEEVARRRVSRSRYRDVADLEVEGRLAPLPPRDPDLLKEIAAARWDIGIFARLLGIDAHDGQRRFWNAILSRDETLWRAAYLTIILSAGNRAGKTLALAIAILHGCFYKTAIKPLGVNPSDREAEVWLKATYTHFHFGIQQEVGELVYHELVGILTGRHVAQKGRGCPLSDVLGEQLATWDVKERGEYRMIVLHPLLGGATVHFRTTNEKALGSLGKDMHQISFDECGFETNLSFIINEVLHLRRLGTGGQLIMTSTPSEGFNEFAEEWRKGDPTNPMRQQDRIALRMSTRDNIGFGIDQSMFDRLVRSMPEELVPQNIDGYFIEGRRAFYNAIAVDRSFVNGSPVSVPPQWGHRYAIGIDPAASKDETWAIVLDITTPGRAIGVHCERRTGRQSIPALIRMLTDLHDRYNSDGSTCTTALDSTGFGGKVFRDLLSGISPLRSIEFGGTAKKKLRILTDAKGLVEQSRLSFPRAGDWLRLRRQLLGYRLDDKGMATDAAMAMCIALTEMVRNGNEATETVPFDMFDERDLSIDKYRLRHLNAARQQEVLANLPVAPEVLAPPDFEPEVRTRLTSDQKRLSASMSLGWGE